MDRYYPPVSPYAAGFGCKCPRCGQGDLFAGFLTLGKECEACQLDYSSADSGDGPAVFMIFIAGFAGVLVLMIARYGFDAPAFVALLLSVLVTVALVLGLMRPLKALMIALQYQNKANEAGLNEDDKDWT